MACLDFINDRLNLALGAASKDDELGLASSEEDCGLATETTLAGTGDENWMRNEKASQLRFSQTQCESMRQSGV